MVHHDAPTVDFTALSSLRGKTFVVLGAGQGIGEQSCLALSQSGAHVVCVDRDTALARDIASKVGGTPCTADVTDREGMRLAFDTALNRTGAVDGLVDVVGIANLGALASVDDDAWAAQFDIVLRHAYLAVQLGAPLMGGRGGSMVFVGSLAGLMSFKQQAAYGTAKAALHHLVRSAAVEYGPQGIRVNAVAPGFIRTPRLNQRLDESQWTAIGRAIPLGRAATPAEIAATVLFLSSPLAGHVTGQILAVDGGLGNVAAIPDLSFKPLQPT